MESSETDREVVRHVHGLYVGQLNEDEMKSFVRCVDDGIAVRDYSGPGGLLGLAKVYMRSALDTR